MCKEIQKTWDEAQLLAVRQWYEGRQGFAEIDEANNFPAGTLYKIVNSIPDYRGTRRSIGRWVRKMCPSATSTQAAECRPKRKYTRKKMKNSLSSTDQEKIERQLMHELEEARKKIARLEAQQAKDTLRRDFLEGQLDEYRKLVKPSQSKKSPTK